MWINSTLQNKATCHCHTTINYSLKIFWLYSNFEISPVVFTKECATVPSSLWQTNLKLKLLKSEDGVGPFFLFNPDKNSTSSPARKVDDMKEVVVIF